ncbi:hypothetical protein EDB19DRAFT_1833600 [Suillus lakei]|nr:hypothetical protein EDB19DRAFT_1833600 [Suillus lakei]
MWKRQKLSHMSLVHRCGWQDNQCHEGTERTFITRWDDEYRWLKVIRLHIQVIRRQISDFTPSGNEHQLPASMWFQITSLTSTASDGPQQPDNGEPNALEGHACSGADYYSSGGPGQVPYVLCFLAIFINSSDIRLTHLPKFEMVAFNGQNFVRLTVEDITETQMISSKTQQDGAPCWDQKCTLTGDSLAVTSLSSTQQPR